MPVTDEWVSAAGADVHYLAWGEPGRRGLVFVHGAGASAHWWTHVAAWFANQYRVIALDLTGHGDSQHRQRYSVEDWVAEIAAASASSGIAGPSVIVGHSVGGLLSTTAAARHPDAFAGVIVCDARITDKTIAPPRPRRSGVERIYATIDEAVAKFRTSPVQPDDLEYVVDYIARRSAKSVDGGYTWKLDSRVFEQIQGNLRRVAWGHLSSLGCRLALLRSEHGLVPEEIGQEMLSVARNGAYVVDLPLAGHHAMLDQPLVLLTAIRSVLASWDFVDRAGSGAGTHSAPSANHDAGGAVTHGISSNW